MPYPAPPPEPPAIIQPAEEIPVLPPSSVGLTADALTQEETTGKVLTSASDLTSVGGTVSAPNPPEIFAPENAIPPSTPPLETTPQSSAPESQAALLGGPMAVGLRVAQPEPQIAAIATGTDTPLPLIAPAQLSPDPLPHRLAQRQPTVLLRNLQAQATEAPPANLPSLSTPAPPGTVPSLPSNAPIPRPANPAPEPVQAPVVPTPPAPATPAPTSPTPATTPGIINPTGMGGIVELSADRQEFDAERQIFTAEGSVVMRFQQAVLDADRLQVNLVNRIAVAEGNVALTRGGQVLRGQRFEYNFVQSAGVIQNASGEIFLPTAGTDFSPTLPTDVSAGGVADRPLSDRITANQPLQQVASPGGVNVVVGAGQDAAAANAAGGGQVRRLRFEAERVEFDTDGWQARNVRITNDPFSPPELELRADEARLTRISPLQDEVRATRPRLVFDQGLSVPILRSRVILDRRRRDPAIASFGFDGTDRGGLFVERTFDLISSERAQLSVTPQFLIQRAVAENSGNIFDPDAYGVKAALDATLGPRTTVRGSAVLTSLDLGDLENRLRASLRLRQQVGTHGLSLEYSYRDRLFNGSLGFQDVQSSLGAVLISPTIRLGQTGIDLSYQAGAQFIRADSDRLDLLEPVRSNNRVSLGRFQASAALSRGFTLWQGQALPATPTEGLRYTPTPVVPYVQLVTGIRGVASGYSSGDSQESLTGTLGIQGQLGQFSRRFFDYTGFNLSYSKTAINGLSPFLFDRLVDTNVLSGGIIQQVYGPFRAGFQTSINLDTNRQISTEYILEYSRRTYGITLRYNPVLELGSLGFRISDFNWAGGTEPFSGAAGVRPVEGGVIRRSDE